ncbi:MAG: ABC transporter permease [Actinomycetota bacterium]|nr:ABC transporter permease [Actinomycetota bacterium]
MVWHELRRRLGRSLAMGCAVLVAAAGFTVLTSSSDASKLATTGTVQKNSVTSYDVLVRPKGARTTQEVSGRLVQPGFLSGIYGGISMGQWQQILHMSGVSVAAPMTVVSTVLPEWVPVDLTNVVSRTAATTLRIDGTWHLPDGRSQQQQPLFAWRTPSSVGAPWSGPKSPPQCQNSPSYVPPLSGLLFTQIPGYLNCDYDLHNGVLRSNKLSGVAEGHSVTPVTTQLPQVLVAVDPTQETKLLGLAGATSTRAMAALQRRVVTAQDGSTVAPVLFSTRPPGPTTLSVTVSTLGAAGNRVVATGKGKNDQLGGLRRLPTRPVAHDTITTGDSERALRSGMRAYPQNASPYTELEYPGSMYQYWTASQPRLTGSGQHFTAVPVKNDLVQLWTSGSFDGTVPVGTDDRNYRTLALHQPPLPQGISNPISFVDKGSFDPGKLAGLDQIAGQVLTGYATAPTTGANPASRAALGYKPVQSSPNIAALVQPAPTMLTNLSALPDLVSHATNAPAGGAPISAIRVKVAGVTGVDAVSKERVRLVAQRISAMGLDVDITVGSSPSQVTLHQPAGTHGQPALLLDQWWAKLGVATTILKALDAKSLGLFILVLLVAGLCVANSAIASVRSRRTDLGVLACVGWTKAALFRLVVTELGAIALVAGVLAAGLSLVLGAAFGTPVSPSRALLAIPASLAVTLVAGFVPAYLAARSDPMDAVRPAVTTPRTPRVTRTVLGLGRGNLSRSRARTVLAVLGLVVATAAFTLLLAITVGFQGAVVGSILGDAVAIQTRTSDYAAALATFALAGIGVGNLMYLNIRDRGPELATLRATGWTEQHLRRLLLTEGALIGAIGGVLGAVLGLAAALVLIGSLPVLVLLAALGTAAAAVLISLVATLLASTLLLRLPTTLLLTE